jgi:hypothetical protein
VRSSYRVVIFRIDGSLGLDGSLVNYVMLEYYRYLFSSSRVNSLNLFDFP